MVTDDELFSTFYEVNNFIPYVVHHRKMRLNLKITTSIYCLINYLKSFHCLYDFLDYKQLICTCISCTSQLYISTTKCLLYNLPVVFVLIQMQTIFKINVSLYNIIFKYLIIVYIYILFFSHFPLSFLLLYGRFTSYEDNFKVFAELLFSCLTALIYFM